MSDDTYQGSANRETWAFNLHWSNDQGLYDMTLELASQSAAQLTDAELGAAVVAYWRDFIDETPQAERSEGLVMWDREVGSWWRIDHTEVGATVRESLGAEDMLPTGT